MSQNVLIFVVEDQAMIQIMIEHALEDAGFAVTAAVSGEDAIVRLDAKGADFRALVTDVNLVPGGATGWDVARRAREIHADMPIVYMTGAAENDWASQGVPGSVLVPKPFVGAQIVTALATLLNRPGSLVAAGE